MIYIYDLEYKKFKKSINKNKTITIIKRSIKEKLFY